jgi:hypothetical protein
VYVSLSNAIDELIKIGPQEKPRPSLRETRCLCFVAFHFSALRASSTCLASVSRALISVCLP